MRWRLSVVRALAIQLWTSEQEQQDGGTSPWKLNDVRDGRVENRSGHSRWMLVLESAVPTRRMQANFLLGASTVDGMLPVKRFIDAEFLQPSTYLEKIKGPACLPLEASGVHCDPIHGIVTGLVTHEPFRVAADSAASIPPAWTKSPSQFVNEFRLTTPFIFT
ncbi:Secondary metabolism regulator LAE1 [Fusarium oxysporum f. sp. albedinis]|nr:Secondary metabolism regulator LAE1 [Fusarium oxysporum f. sp. albedinis]